MVKCCDSGLCSVKWGGVSDEVKVIVRWYTVGYRLLTSSEIIYNTKSVKIQQNLISNIILSLVSTVYIKSLDNSVY